MATECAGNGALQEDGTCRCYHFFMQGPDCSMDMRLAYPSVMIWQVLLVLAHAAFAVMATLVVRYKVKFLKCRISFKVATVVCLSAVSAQWVRVLIMLVITVDAWAISMGLANIWALLAGCGVQSLCVLLFRMWSTMSHKDSKLVRGVGEGLSSLIYGIIILSTLAGAIVAFSGNVSLGIQLNLISALLLLLTVTYLGVMSRQVSRQLVNTSFAILRTVLRRMSRLSIVVIVATLVFVASNGALDLTTPFGLIAYSAMQSISHFWVPLICVDVWSMRTCSLLQLARRALRANFKSQIDSSNLEERSALSSRLVDYSDRDASTKDAEAGVSPRPTSS